VKPGRALQLVVTMALGLASLAGCRPAGQVEQNDGVREVLQAVGPTPAGDSQGIAGPDLGVQQRIALAYPRVDVGNLARVGSREALNRSVADDVSEWPAMMYMGESAGIGNVAVTPQEVRIVAGSTVPRAYSPEGDRAVDAPTGSPPGIRGQDNRPVLVIPAGASLVMVRIETDPSVGRWLGPGHFSCPDGSTSDWGYAPGNFRLSYPGLGEAEAESGLFWFGEFQYPAFGCPADGWLYFIVAERDIDRSRLWLEYVAGTQPGDLAFWTLTGRPVEGEADGGE
jgi:hypothetical protein